MPTSHPGAVSEQAYEHENQARRNRHEKRKEGSHLPVIAAALAGNAKAVRCAGREIRKDGSQDESRKPSDADDPFERKV